MVGDVSVEGLSAGRSPGSVSNGKSTPVYFLAKLTGDMGLHKRKR